mmetsp:Transcript_38227/g.46638  ORF Transcript_38227/g.46638 Transcript_38227/m.46638 type:complete len:411 (-) Transcript_38227:102-1334(-)
MMLSSSVYELEKMSQKNEEYRLKRRLIMVIGTGVLAFVFLGMVLSSNVGGSLFMSQQRLLSEAAEIFNGQRLHATVHPSIVKSVKREGGKSSPRIAQLIGFPLSGQDFLQRAIHDMTKTSTAINYGEAVMLTSGMIISDAISSVPLYQNNPHGPFAFSNVHPFPDHGHVLTRTYCSGHCSNCWPQDYIIQSVRLFQYECNVGKRLETNGKVVDTYYDSERIFRYIHLIRDPLSQVFARFDHEYTRWSHLNRHDMIKAYPHSKDGFHKWCSDFDDNIHDGRRFEIERYYYMKDKEFEKLARKVPCHSNFFRLVQWHNYAFQMTHDEHTLHGKPNKVIYFEDLVNRPKRVLNEVLDYLKLEEKSHQFARSNELTNAVNFYEPKHIVALKKYLKQLATKKTWSHLEHYFDELL